MEFSYLKIWHQCSFLVFICSSTEKSVNLVIFYYFFKTFAIFSFVVNPTKKTISGVYIFRFEKKQNSKHFRRQKSV